MFNLYYCFLFSWFALFTLFTFMTQFLQTLFGELFLKYLQVALPLDIPNIEWCCESFLISRQSVEERWNIRKNRMGWTRRGHRSFFLCSIMQKIVLSGNGESNSKTPSEHTDSNFSHLQDRCYWGVMRKWNEVNQDPIIIIIIILTQRCTLEPLMSIGGNEKIRFDVYSD